MRSGIDVAQIKKLRDETGAGVMEVKRALEESGGDFEAAKKILAKAGAVKASQKAARAAGEGRIFAYIHGTGKIGAMLELFCETDFVARTDDFQTLGRELVMQVAAMTPSDRRDLLNQDYIRDPAKTVRALITETIAKVGENIKLGRFTRYQI